MQSYEIFLKTSHGIVTSAVKLYGCQIKTRKPKEMKGKHFEYTVTQLFMQV